MEHIETVNAKITGTMLGIEDHGIMTCNLQMEWPSHFQGFGGYCLSTFNKQLNRRVGTAYGMQFILEILETVGVEKWEDLKGKYVRIKTTHEKMLQIGHITEEKWFNPSKDLEFIKNL